MADGQAADALLALGRAVVTSEFRINGVHRDPLKVTLPPPEPLPGALMAKFRAVTAPYIRQLAQAELRSATVAQR